MFEEMLTVAQSMSMTVVSMLPVTFALGIVFTLLSVF